MQVNKVALGIGAAVVGLGVAVGLAGCAQETGPAASLTKGLFATMTPEGGRTPKSFNVATDGVVELHKDDGSPQGTIDGTRLLQAADAHAYGTPVVFDAAKDLQGDGTATFNEIRQVVYSFDTDHDDRWGVGEAKPFEAAVGPVYTPAAR